MGIDLIRLAKKHSSQIIFLASQTEYAAKAFEIGAQDYLVKPVKYERFLISLERSLKYIGNESFISKKKFILKKSKIQKPYSDILIISNHNEKKLISFHDIIIIQSINSYSEVKTSTNCFLTSKSLNSLESLLDKDLFFRVSRTYIINLSFFDSITSEKDGFYIQLKDKTQLKMSRSRYRILNLKLKENLLHL